MRRSCSNAAENIWEKRMRTDKREEQSKGGTDQTSVKNKVREKLLLYGVAAWL
jgi:hypothetical protein